MTPGMEWMPELPFPGEFHAVAKRVYRDDPDWIPESPGMLAFLFGPRNRYFERNAAWIACEPGAARLAGFYNPELLIGGRRVAFFGYWETMDSGAVNDALFTEFESWARSKGARDIYGPINFTTFGSYRIRLDRFDAGCFHGEPYNPPHYRRLLEDMGYRLCQRYVSLLTDIRVKFPQLYDLAKDDIARAERDGFTLEPLEPSFLLDNADELYSFVDGIFSGNFAYTGIGREEFRNGFAAPLARMLCPRSSVMARSPGGEIAGFFITIPDYRELLRQGASAAMTPLEIGYDRHFPSLREPSVLLKTVGTSPQWRDRGLFTAMYYHAVKWALPHYRRCIAATIREDNYSMKVAQRFFAGTGEVRHEYGLFAKSL